MFGDTLLESSPAARKGKRWPMATAFTLQIIVAAIVVAVPLLSTGVIPLSAHPPTYAPPLKPIPLEQPRPVPTDSTTHHGPIDSLPQQTAVVLVNNNPNAIHLGPPVPTTDRPEEAREGGSYNPANNTNVPCDLVGCGKDSGPVVRQEPTRRISVPSEALLIHRVEPVYPRPAVLSGIQGQVKLHAIIARDGRVVSLSVISGSPLLAGAAVEAVSQWRYRPYYLNGEPVEVETFVTVNFKREGR